MQGTTIQKVVKISFQSGCELFRPLLCRSSQKTQKLELWIVQGQCYMTMYTSSWWHPTEGIRQGLGLTGCVLLSTHAPLPFSPFIVHPTGTPKLHALMKITSVVECTAVLCQTFWSACSSVGLTYAKWSATDNSKDYRAK